MEKNFRPMSETNAHVMTSFHCDTINCSTNSLIDIFGEPDRYDDYEFDKTTREFCAETADGIPFYIYDWKEYREFDDDEVIEWHIGANSAEDSNKVYKLLDGIINGAK